MQMQAQDGSQTFRSRDGRWFERTGERRAPRAGEQYASSVFPGIVIRASYDYEQEREQDIVREVEDNRMSPRDAAIREEIERLTELVEIRQGQYRNGFLPAGRALVDGQIQGWMDARAALDALVGIERSNREES